MKQKWILLPVFFLILSGFMLSISQLPTQNSTIFSGSGVCVQCHAGSAGVLTTVNGRDVSPPAGWQSSMMGNSSKDPYWQAKVSAEVDAHLSFQTIIEDKCLTCHAPMGRTEAIYLGQNHFSMAEAMADPLSLDGVSCTVCHQISGENLGKSVSFSGNYIITDERKIFGPYENVFQNPMINQVNFSPLYGPQVKESALCATCHTLFTPFLDDSLNIAGYFPEQTPFLEWLNSKYPENEQTCQSCHMPAVNETMKISSLPPSLSNKWSPVWEHEFVGGNAFMAKMLKLKAADLGVNASAANLDTTVRYTEAMLRRAILLSVNHYMEGSNLVIEVLLENLTGHKFPTGFPSRRAWMHLEVMDAQGSTIFESGEYDADGVIADQDASYEPHHKNIIVDSDVQIYEAVMGDVNDDVTFTLLRGATYLKDNRLLPAGYLSGEVADSVTGSSGGALSDPDFNRDGSGAEGSGSDIIFYRIPVENPGSVYSYEVELVYQSVSQDFIADLVNHDQAPVNEFLQMYQEADKQPFSIANLSGMFVPEYLDISEQDQIFKVFPNPASHQIEMLFSLNKTSLADISLVDLSGMKVRQIYKGTLSGGDHRYEIRLSESERTASELLLLLKVDDRTYSQKIVILR